MSDLFYSAVKLLGTPAFLLSAAPTVVRAELTDRPGPYLLAANHTSPFDIPLLIRHARRRLDFVSITEVFRSPLMAWFYGSMNAFPLERSRPDPATTRIVLERLRRGRVVAMFPEGGFRRGDRSVLRGGPVRPGIARLAILAQVPILPVAVLHSDAYCRFAAWLPLRRTRYALCFGEPLLPPPHAPPADAPRAREAARAAARDLEAKLASRLQALAREVQPATDPRPVPDSVTAGSASRPRS